MRRLWLWIRPEIRVIDDVEFTGISMNPLPGYDMRVRADHYERCWRWQVRWPTRRH
jgi:hypothetical protein